MEEKIKEAKETKSWSAIGCKIVSTIGILTTLIYAIIFITGKTNKDIYFWFITMAALGSSVSIGAVGSLAESSKKNKALTELLVESTNSASQLPISKEFEYSDLNEDN
tara:strand:+ start:140 stop:463 length:324 start_codon:yes stop_codon:yes gene_type:complete